VSGFLRQLLARASGQGGGPRVQPASAAALAAPAAWGEVDEEAEAPAARAGSRAQTADESAPHSVAPREPAPLRLTTPPSAPNPALAPPATQLAPLREPDAQSATSWPAPAARPAAAAPVAMARSAAEPAASRIAVSRPVPLLPPRSAPPVDAAREPRADAPPARSRALRRQTEPAGALGAEASESVVHVSIGRVELTALTPPAAARAKSAPRQPTTSLADYLRGGGARK
jgi:hypothetical protein